MTGRAVSFVNNWIANKVNPEQWGKSENELAASLAAQCLEEARAENIDVVEIEEDFGDLTALMLDAIAEAQKFTVRNNADDISPPHHA